MRDLERALKAAADPTRTRILKMLEAADLCVCQIQAVLRLAPSTVSKHLSLLRAAGLVDARREGRWVVYFLAEATRPGAAGKVLALVRGELSGDPNIAADRRRLREILRIPREEICIVPEPAPAPRRRSRSHA